MHIFYLPLLKPIKSNSSNTSQWEKVHHGTNNKWQPFPYRIMSFYFMFCIFIKCLGSRPCQISLKKNHISVKNFRSLLSLVFIFSEGIWNFTIWKTTWARPFEYLGYYGSTPLPSSIKMLFSENYYFRMDLKFDITLIKMKIFGLSFFRQMWDFALSICKETTLTLCIP